MIFIAISTILVIFTGAVVIGEACEGHLPSGGTFKRFACALALLLFNCAIFG